MQEGPQALGPRPVKGRLGAVGPGRAVAQAVQPRGVEGGNRPADRLVITAEVAGDLERALAPRTGEEMQQVVEEMFRLPPEVLVKVKELGP